MKGFLEAISTSNEKEIRRHIDNGCNPNQSFIQDCCERKPLGYAFMQTADKRCIRVLIDAGANPYKCGLIKQVLPKYWFDFAKSRASVRSCAILAMGAMYKTYGKDVARIIGRVIWETRGYGAAPRSGAANAKKIKK